MSILAKFGGHRSYGNGEINRYINSYMNNLEKAKLSALICYIERISELGILTYNS